VKSLSTLLRVNDARLLDVRLIAWAIRQLSSLHSPEADKKLDSYSAQIAKLPDGSEAKSKLAWLPEEIRSVASAATPNASLHGIVLSADSTPVRGTKITANFTLPPSAHAPLQVATALTPGAYTFCVQAATSAFVDHCHWAHPPQKGLHPQRPPGRSRQRIERARPCGRHLARTDGRHHPNRPVLPGLRFRQGRRRAEPHSQHPAEHQPSRASTSSSSMKPEKPSPPTAPPSRSATTARSTTQKVSSST
jgi:hypothetical protein